MNGYLMSTGGIILGLIVLLCILLLIRFILVKLINKKDIEFACRIVIGSEEIQEDEIGVEETINGTIGILADGLGKREAGKISSIYAVKTIKNMFVNEGSNEMQNYFFKKAYNKANHEIIKRVEKDKGGASVLSVIITEGMLNYALIGDTMLSIFRKNELIKISEGHSINEVARKQYDDGKIQKKEALSVLKEKKLLYYLGQESFKDIEINDTPIKLYKGDIVVLMSKGIYSGIKWIELEARLSEKKKICDIASDIMNHVKINCNGSILLMQYKGKNK